MAHIVLIYTCQLISGYTRRLLLVMLHFFFSSRRRHTIFKCDWSSDVCSSDLSGVPLQHAYFPGTAIVSLHYVTTSGASSETAGVGHEGVVGVPLFMGGGSTPGSAVEIGRGTRLNSSHT